MKVIKEESSQRGLKVGSQGTETCQEPGGEEVSEGLKWRANSTLARKEQMRRFITEVTKAVLLWKCHLRWALV